MKSNIFFLLILGFVCSLTVYSQTNDPVNAPFVGTWNYQNGNQIFQLIIWEDPEPDLNDGSYCLRGHYKMIDLSSGNPTVIYKSDSDAPVGLKWPSAFIGHVFSGNIFGATFHEIHSGSSFLYGDLSIRLLDVCPTCPAKISFNLVKEKGIRFYDVGEPIISDFVVPNNIELTKQ
ncbi:MULTISPECIES: hypothetical protein [Flavobacterium]|uniref:Lipocalin-like domain-containing protein n=1 Tax=Flavobacterium aurantiibacter TaxID=2023067 RepID=A0A255ZN39_9FLAO|nr:hypothetical protein [Flavobacterium aurantiibacter]OYQ42918.1 hypothetical protein CHX27_11125 [Flavobacterium aurantiibacter]